MDNIKELIENADVKKIYSSIKNTNFKDEEEEKSFFEQLFKKNKINPNPKILEILDFLINNKNPFSNISDVDCLGILLYSKMRYWYYTNTNDDDIFFNILLKIKKDNIFYVKALILIGTHYTKFDQLGKAFKFYSEANGLLPNFKNMHEIHPMKVMIYANLAYVYSIAKFYDKSEYYFTKASEHLLDNNIHSQLIMNLNRAQVKMKSGKTTSAEYLKELNEIEKKNTGNFAYIILNITVRKSSLYLDEKNSESAYQVIMEYLKDKPLTSEQLIINLLICFYNLKKYDKYEELYKKEIERLIDFSKSDPKHNIIENAIKIAKKKKDKEWEVECLYHKIKFDSIFYKNSRRFLLEMAQNEHDLKVNEKKLEYEKVKAQNQSKYNQELVNKNKELESFASIVAHDIKSPLRSMVSLLDILESSLDLNEKELEIFTYIKDSNIKLDKFVNDLMNYAKYGRSVDKYSFIDLNVIFEEIQFLLKETITQNNATINIKSKLPKLYAYESACTQLFLNLINNSIKFRKPDCLPKIDVWHETDSEKVYIYLKDNGIGIQKEDLSKIFQPFKRGRTNVKIDGIGIGLATCQKIIDNIKATISVDSKINQYTTFKIEIAKNLTETK